MTGPAHVSSVHILEATLLFILLKAIYVVICKLASSHWGAPQQTSLQLTQQSRQQLHPLVPLQLRLPS